MIPYSSCQVANWFINKSKKRLDTVSLIKLVYISHCWYLTLTNGSPLISEDAQAWKFGAVFPELYHRIKEYGSGRVKELIYLPWGDDNGDYHKILPLVQENDYKIIEFLEKIFDTYNIENSLDNFIHAKNGAYKRRWKIMEEHGLTQSAMPYKYMIDQCNEIMIQDQSLKEFKNNGSSLELCFPFLFDNE